MRSLDSDAQADPVENCILAYVRTVEGQSKITLYSGTENEATTDYFQDLYMLTNYRFKQVKNYRISTNTLMQRKEKYPTFHSDSAGPPVLFRTIKENWHVKDH